jgi:uncharacterized membrane protein YfcA
MLGAVIGVLPGYIAYRKGKRFLPWWIFGALLFIVALPVSLVLKTERERARTAAARGRDEEMPALWS